MKSGTSFFAAQNNELRALKGVGPELERKLRAEGLCTYHDLVTLHPRTYRDWRTPNTVAELGLQLIAPEADEALNEVVLVGTIGEPRTLRARVNITKAAFSDETGECEVVWFGRGGPRLQLEAGARLLIQGRPKLIRGRGGVRVEVAVVTHRKLPADEAYSGKLWPVYPATRELSSRVLAMVIARNLPELLTVIEPDRLPDELMQRLELLPIRAAWQELHDPESFETIEHAEQRVAFEKFFGIALNVAHRRLTLRSSGGAIQMPLPAKLHERFAAELPFALTAAQVRVIDEIWHDLAQAAPMNRLLQGDVGSGKTVVAAAAIVLAANAGAQSALMAPTELLARQHSRKLAPLLLPFGIGVEFIAATQNARARRESEERLASGAICVAVGTHALLTERVSFARLGLAIIDEQHRFGVMQRATLRSKGEAVHTLAMTATPIPRTLAQTRYADLDFSVIDMLPPGRTPIKTFVRDESARPKIYEFLRKEVAAGHQAYIVAPVIEEGDSALRSALAEADLLTNRIFPDLRVGLVHGRLPPRERESVMERFAAHELDILIATTVIEVGVDVPNANVMVILEAHRFGLAQLHQLRGRVGRGTTAATCILLAPRKTARLDILTRTNDGFAIADADLEMRGEGEFSGTLQSGSGQLLLRGRDEVTLYLMAKAEAEALLESDLELQRPEHARVHKYLEDAQSNAAVRIMS